MFYVTVCISIINIYVTYVYTCIHGVHLISLNPKAHSTLTAHTAHSTLTTLIALTALKACAASVRGLGRSVGNKVRVVRLRDGSNSQCVLCLCLFGEAEVCRLHSLLHHLCGAWGALWPRQHRIQRGGGRGRFGREEEKTRTRG